MIAKIFIVLAVLVVLFLIVAALQSPDYAVSRTTTIASPASVPFAYVNDLHRWQEISPYVKMDPAAKYTFDGPAAGPGASLAWAGNAKVGEGKMTIVETQPNQLARMRLDFKKPFATVGMADFTFEPAGNDTRVTWSMKGKKVFITKAMGLILSMDKMVGPQFEEGLAKMKSLSEANAAK